MVSGTKIEKKSHSFSEIYYWLLSNIGTWKMKTIWINEWNEYLAAHEQFRSMTPSQAVWVGHRFVLDEIRCGPHRGCPGGGKGVPGPQDWTGCPVWDQKFVVGLVLLYAGIFRSSNKKVKINRPPVTAPISGSKLFKSLKKRLQDDGYYMWLYKDHEKMIM